MNITSWVDTNIVTPATNYIKTRSYLNFNQNVDTIYDDSVDLGFCPPNENKQQSIKMEYLGTELYDIHTGKYAVNMLYADLTWKQHTHFNENKKDYNITRGLLGKKMDSKNIHFKYDVHFFTKFTKSNTSSINYLQNYSISNALNDYILQNRDEHTSMEFFGYFKSTITGIYNIKITTGNDDAALLWIGDDALINYSMTNIISDNKSTSLAVKVVKDKYYPIRIQYGTQKNSNLIIELVSDTTGSALSIDDYLFSINKSNVPYEPIQLCFSFIKTNDSETLFRLMVSKYDINNNAEYNTLIRKSLSEPKILYNDIPLFPAGLLSFQNTGNLILTDTTGNTIDLTKIPNYMNCQEGTNIANTPDIQLNNNSITPKLTTNQTKEIDVKTGLPYTQFTYSGSGSSNPSDIYSASYVLGNTAKNNTFSSIPDINVNNLNKVAQCSFTLTLTNDGDIQINNEKKIIWTLFKGIISNKKFTSPFAQVATKIKNAMNSSIVVRDWYEEYYNSYMNSQNSVMRNTMKGGSNFTNSLIASNGKCKMMIDANGGYVFRYARPLPKGRKYITTNEYNSGLVYIYSARMDMKIGKTFLANSTDNSIQYIPTTIDGASSILQYSSSYTKYNGKYPNPPNVLETGGNYLHWQNVDTPCDIMCNKTNGCTHYYSYKTTDGATHCTINNDGTSARYYPKKPKDNINSANLFIRDKIIKSECNVNKFIQYDPKIKSVIGGTAITNPESVSQDNQSKFFRFDVIKNRGAKYTQISKITFYNNNNNNIPFSEAVASSNTRSPSNEAPQNAIGDNIKKKWLSYNSISSLYITFSNPITMNQYSITTANDVPDRDPISWNLYSSSDNKIWNLIDSKDNYPMPTKRFTQTPIINTTPIKSTTQTSSTQLLNTSDSASAYDTYAINYSAYPTTTTEGPCGDPIINANINSFLTTSGTQKEGFSSTGGWRESFTSVCDSSNPNVDACRTELVNKVTSLQNNEANIFNKTQEKINANYNKLNSDINDYKTLQSKVNGPYDAVDHQGDLKYIYNNNNPSKYLEDIRFEDSKQQLLAENNLYIIGTIISATLLILTVISLTDKS